MNKTATYAVLVAATVVLSGLAVYVVVNQQTATQSPPPTHYTYRILNTYPHDTGAYTEGLVFSDGELFESTGLVGASSLRRVDLHSGNVLQQHTLSGGLYGEGLAAVEDTLVQLTWRNHVGFVYDKQTFDLMRNFSLATEGWGLTYDGASLILSDGSSTLYFLDPASYQVTGQVTVKDGEREVTKINELEYIAGDVYANIWHSTNVAIIDPETGQVKGLVDLGGLHQPTGLDDVLNGIAYNEETGGLFVTGKNWPSLYQIELVAKAS